MRTLSRLALVSLLFCWSSVAFTAGLQNLRARFEGGQVHIFWSAPDVKPAYYNVYFSRNSIIGNNGAYDDFEKADGSRTDFILATFPQTSKLFIAVLPVDANGKETVGFSDEVALPLTEGSEATATALGIGGQNPATAPVVAAPENVQNVELKFEQQQNGKYMVVAAWDAPASPVASYQVLHSTDGGVTFSEPQAIASGTRFVRFTDVLPGQFTVIIRTLNRIGDISTGATANVTLVPTIAQPQTSQSLPKNLTQSGVGLFGLLAVSGGIAGWKKAKNKKK